VNLDLPFPEPDRSAIDEVIEAISAELDALFLDEVDGLLRGVRSERETKPDAAAA
jgi:hypothetical protein